MKNKLNILLCIFIIASAIGVILFFAFFKSNPELAIAGYKIFIGGLLGTCITAIVYMFYDR